MTRRGRHTLAAVAGIAVAGLLALAVDPQISVLPPVSAPPPGAEALAPVPVEVPENLFTRLPVTRAALDMRVTEPGAAPGVAGSADARGRLVERVLIPGNGLLPSEVVYVEYSLDAELTRHVFRVLERGRVKLGHVILLDPRNGRVLAYASTDTKQFPPTRSYPAASLVKVITAAAALDHAPESARLPCRFQGSPYRLTPSRLDPPRRGATVSLRRALATSNNQCFAQLAVHAVGGGPLVAALERFGWRAAPAPEHAVGSVDPGESRYDLGRLGCGLAGCHITPMHAAQLAASLARGELVAPHWIERVIDSRGRELPLPARPTPRQVMSPKLAAELRGMLIDTTRIGTARSAFRKRSGKPLLGPVQVAGKTGSLSGRDPTGRYEWFIGAAPAEEPRIAVAVLLVQGHLWWRNASQIAAEVLRGPFCRDGSCSAEAALRFLEGTADTPGPGQAL